MTPEEWKIWKRINARPAKALAAYPDLERQDFDETLDLPERRARIGSGLDEMVGGRQMSAVGTKQTC
jgi:hypothetical protein